MVLPAHAGGSHPCADGLHFNPACVQPPRGVSHGNSNDPKHLAPTTSPDRQLATQPTTAHRPPTPWAPAVVTTFCEGWLVENRLRIFLPGRTRTLRTRVHRRPSEDLSRACSANLGARCTKRCSPGHFRPHGRRLRRTGTVGSHRKSRHRRACLKHCRFVERWRAGAPRAA